MSRFYITTPIYYVNDKPHLGTAYSTTCADVLTKYHRLFGDESYFLTGTDEHGQKVEQSAAGRGKDPQSHCDEMAEIFKVAWAQMGIQYDQFIRTTQPFHKQAVQTVLQKLFDKGEIYASTYEGWYSVSDEIFYMEKDLVDGRAPTGKEVIKISEKNYFFKMSKYQNELLKYIDQHPDFIQPDFRRNEVLGFLKQPLEDLCISRPKSRLKWGIEIPFDKDYVTYVWFDALLNYATGVGLEQKGREQEYKKWWDDARAVHLIGKDILKTHAVYWPTMLMAAGMTLPKTIFAHGWILNKDNEKMSKSKGSVMSPAEMTKMVGVDPLRYFLCRDIPLGNDAPVSHELIVGRINTDLANNLGNLLSRSTNLITKFFDGKAPAAEGTGGSLSEATQTLKKHAVLVADQVQKSVEQFRIHDAIEHVVQLLNETNKYLEDRAPWKAAKTDLPGAGESLYAAIEVLRIAGTLLSPVMPESMTKLLNTIGIQKADFTAAKKWGEIQTGSAIAKSEPLFPRIDLG